MLITLFITNYEDKTPGQWLQIKPSDNQCKDIVDCAVKNITINNVSSHFDHLEVFAADWFMVAGIDNYGNCEMHQRYA